LKQKNKAGETSDMSRLSLKDEYAKISYCVGYQVGGDFKRQYLTLQPELFLKGIQDALDGNELLMSKAEMQQILTDLKKKIVASEQEEKKKEAEKNLAKGKTFLSKNEKKRGVRTLESGLQYRILKKGSGALPKPTDMVTLHYKGTLIDGKEFDSSYKKGDPATFRADSCIRGWKEALQMMKVGAKWKLFIPPDLAYGERGAGLISPNSTLVFNLELISVRRSR